MANEVSIGKYNVIVEEWQGEDAEGPHESWVEIPIEIDSDEHLTIDETNVDGELAKMGHVLGYYGDIAARLKTQLARKEEDLEAIEAHIDHSLRQSFAQVGQKFTETQLKKAIINDPTYKKSLDELQRNRVYSYRVDNLFKALVKKCDALNCLGYSQRQERKTY